MKNLKIFLALVFCFPLQGNAQVQIDANQQTLLLTLSELQAKYGIQYSYTADLADACEVNLRAEFKEMNDALAAILQPCGLVFQKYASVYIIKQARARVVETRSDCVFEGRLIDAENGNALPNVVIKYAGGRTLSNENGYFEILMEPNTDPVRFSHIAYQDIDTVLTNNERHTLPLNPEEMALPTVLIEDWYPNDSSYMDVKIIKALQADELKAGLYQSATEVINNQPSLPWVVQSDQKRSYRIKKTWIDNTVRLRMPYDLAPKTNVLWGFCDGQDLYVNVSHNNLFRYGSEFAKLHLVGPYLYYEFVSIDLVLPELTELEYWVVDLRTGESKKLNKRFVRQQIIADSVLSASFQSKLIKNNKLGEYLFRFYNTPFPDE